MKPCVALLTGSLLALSQLHATEAVISEFMAANGGTLLDEDGDSSDWIEIHNGGTNTVNLAGWFLTDNATAPSKWRFPAVTFAPGQFRLVWASAKNRTNSAAPLHANFKLDRGGGYLALLDANTNVVSAFNPYPSQFTDVSYGSASPSNSFGYFATPTPGATNATQFSGRTDAPGFSHKRGFYNTNFSLALTSETAGATIYFTTNGTPPSPTNGVAYSAPLAITRTTIIRAAAFAPGLLPSDTHTHSFLFTRDIIRQPDRVPPPGWPATWGVNVVDYGMDTNVVNDPRYAGTIESDLRVMPSLCLVMDLKDLFDRTNGIYANAIQDGIEWERPTSLELIYPDGTDGFQEQAGLRIRGGFSRAPDDPKHSFRLFFREEYGARRLNFPIFGPGAASSFDKFDLRCTQDASWAYSGDVNGTFMPDTFARDTQGALGQPYTRGYFYHLYINGVYWGEYNTEERPEASYAANYFGGAQEDYDIVRVEYGPFDVTPADGDLNAWRRLWQAATNGFASNANYQRVQGNNPDGTPNPAYEVLVDMDNLIDYMLLTIYVGNYDGPVYQNSFPNNFFALRNRNTRKGFRFITHDAELSLSDVNLDRTTTITVGDPAAGSMFSESNPQYVWQRLWANAEFRLRAADHVQRHFFNGGALTPAACLARYAARTNELSRGMVGESARWGDSKREPPILRENWIAAVSRVMTNYLPYRSGIVLQQLRNRGLYPNLAAPNFSQFGGTVPDGYELVLSHTNASGAIYFTTDGSDPRLIGGSANPSVQSYSLPIPINEPLYVRARVLNGTNWSAIVEAVFQPPQDLTRLLVTEIMYNPPDVGLTNGDEFEFVELKNTGSATLNLSNLRFTGGITFNFSNGSFLGAGQFFVLVRNPTQFAAKYPDVTINGVYSGGLDNGGENLRLTAIAGGTVISITYDDRTPWPVPPDGFGFSLVPVNPNGNPDPDGASNWRSSTLAGGSPGEDDPGPANIARVLINEALTATVFPERDMIELFNPTATPVDIGGWFLTDEPDTPKKYRIPPGTMINPDAYLVFDESQFNATPGASNNFSLRAEGDDVYLFSADAAGDLTGYSHGFSFGAAAHGVSFGRQVNSQGEEDFTAQIAGTFGTNNAGPRIGPVVINEIMYHPDAGNDEFIEVRNISGAPVELFDVATPTNSWRINGLGFDFPTNVTLGSNGLLLVVTTDPAAFRAKYLVPPAVPILGPYAGQLQDSGERLELQRPGPLDTNSGVAYITVDMVRYNDKAPWPPAADGSGPSLQRKNALVYGNEPLNWEAALPTPGRVFTGGTPPTITLQPVNVSVIATREALFTVAATGPAPLFYQWRFNGSPIAGATNTMLVLTNLQFSQAGNYTALAFNEAGSVESDAAVLTVLTPASILVQPTNAMVRIKPDPLALQNTNATFYTSASSATPLHYQWQMNGVQIAGATSPTLVITNVQLASSGDYRCAITDDAGTVFTQPARLIPLITPVIIQPPLSQTVPAGGLVSLSVALGEGNPAPFYYEWRRGSVIIGAFPNSAKTNVFTFLAHSNLVSQQYRLIITNLATTNIQAVGTVFNITTLADNDHDGLPDALEVSLGLNTNNAADAALDLDGDTMSNGAEYLAGTDPVNPLSFLKLDLATSAGRALVHFDAVSNRTYSVLYSDSSSGGSWFRLSDIVGRINNRSELIVDPSSTSNRFYRLVTPRQP
jgi:hypothetical protein